MPARNLRAGDELDTAFEWTKTEKTDDGCPVFIARCNGKQPHGGGRCVSTWEIVPDAVDEDGTLVVDLGTRSSLLAHAQSHTRRHKMRRIV